MKVFDMVFIGLCWNERKLIHESSTLPLFENRRDWYLDIKKLNSLTIGRTYSVREFTDAYSGLYVFEDDNGTTLSTHSF